MSPFFSFGASAAETVLDQQAQVLGEFPPNSDQELVERVLAHEVADPFRCLPIVAATALVAGKESDVRVGLSIESDREALPFPVVLA